MSSPDILVLRREVHGIPIQEYHKAIQSRLPEYDVQLARTPAEEYDMLPGVPIATGLSLDESLLEQTTDLDLFACLYAGTDHLPLEAFKEQGVRVTNAGGVHGPNVAEWVIGMMLVFARELHEGMRRKQRREWRHYQAGELNGSTVTVVGLGPIGQAVTARLEGFNVNTIGVRYTPEKGGPTDSVIGFDADAFHEALAETDYLVLACPLTETTMGLVDEAAFETLPPSAVLLNIARGPVVDTDALVAELQGEGLRGAALDVTDPEPLPEDHVLWTFGNVLITPHNAGYTPDYYERVADILAGNVKILEEDGSSSGLKNLVSF